MVATHIRVSNLCHICLHSRSVIFLAPSRYSMFSSQYCLLYYTNYQSWNNIEYSIKIYIYIIYCVPLVCSTRTLLLIVQLFIFTDECGRCFYVFNTKKKFLVFHISFLVNWVQIFQEIDIHLWAEIKYKFML